jgi:putative effector of murein hydrolase LrgA (UPF0299 family)
MGAAMSSLQDVLTKLLPDKAWKLACSIVIGTSLLFWSLGWVIAPITAVLPNVSQTVVIIGAFVAYCCVGLLLVSAFDGVLARALVWKQKKRKAKDHVSQGIKSLADAPDIAVALLKSMRKEGKKSIRLEDPRGVLHDMVLDGLLVYDDEKYSAEERRYLVPDHIWAELANEEFRSEVKPLRVVRSALE